MRSKFPENHQAMNGIRNNLIECRRVCLRNNSQRGITLVEMLVVVALTVLLMSIVAEVFALASETLSSLRALSDVNQKVRLVESTIRNDLANRTIREVQPPVERVLFGPGADGIYGTPDDDYYIKPVGIDPAKNLGYFMISEDSPADEQGEDTDDILAFTVRLRQSSQGQAGGIITAYYGRAVQGSEPDNAFGPAGDGLAGSQEAEIIYFLRRGTLYRRVLLVGVSQPSTWNPQHSWYEQYDISARPNPASTQASPLVPIVNTLGDLTYRSPRFLHRTPYGYDTGINTTTPPIPPGLGTDYPGNQGSNGAAPNAPFPFLPLEFDDTNGNLYHDATNASDEVDHNQNYPSRIALSAPEPWYGRATLRETSAYDSAGTQTWKFPNFPASSTLLSADPRPYDTSPYLYRTRPAQDALLTNVLSFDIKVWDPDAIPNPSASTDPTGAFVDLGKLWPGASGSVNTPGPRPSGGTLVGLPGLSPAPPAGPQVGTWPPQRAAGVIAASGRGFGEPFGYDASGSPPYAIAPGTPGLPLGMLRAPVSLCRTYDTWCSAYTKPTQVGVVPYAPPYIVPLRGIQIKIRFADPVSRLTREITIVQDLQ